MTSFSGKQAFRTSRIIHFAMMAGLTFFSAVVVFLNTSSDRTNSEIDTTILLIVAGFVTAMSIFMSSIIYKQHLSKLKGDESLQTKLAIFQTAQLIRSAMFEAGGLLGAVICIITGDLFGLAFTAISIGMFILKMPTPDMLEQDLHLSSSEKQQLTD